MHNKGMQIHRCMKYWHYLHANKSYALTIYIYIYIYIIYISNFFHINSSVYDSRTLRNLYHRKTYFIKKIENRQTFFRPIKSHISFTQNISFKSNISMNVYSKLGLKRFDV